MLTRTANGDLMWIDDIDDTHRWVTVNKKTYHAHLYGRRPTLVGHDSKCKRCGKILPPLVALAFMLNMEDKT